MIYLLTAIVAILAYIIRQLHTDRKHAARMARYDQCIERMKGHGWRE